MRVVRDTGFKVRRTVDLTHHEKDGRFLEGTGSLVLDHVERVAYACRSPRTDEDVAREWAREWAIELEMFTARDARGTPIYHTNVVMSIGTRMAVVALDNIDAGRPRPYRQPARRRTRGAGHRRRRDARLRRQCARSSAPGTNTSATCASW